MPQSAEGRFEARVATPQRVHASTLRALLVVVVAVNVLGLVALLAASWTQHSGSLSFAMAVLGFYTGVLCRVLRRSAI